jgi:inosine-uridine nucleoside N-ribohydrolase
VTTEELRRVAVHVDTDLGTNPDDVCALAYLLARTDVDLVGVTTVSDPDGARAGLAREVLRLAGRPDVPVARGSTTEAGELLGRSVQAGAVVVGIGPATTLGAASRAASDLLAGSHVVLMGGVVEPSGPGLPPWSAADDTNLVADEGAARAVHVAAGRLTIVPLAAGAQCHLRMADLPALATSGPLGALMAEQVSAYRVSAGRDVLAARWPGLPEDLANFHHDPLTAAVAVGWPGVTVRRTRMQGRDADVVVDVDGPAFGAHWLATVTGRG